MTTLEFESQPAVLGSVKASTAPLRRVSRAARARLAVVSTYDDLCGIAAYTRSLERQLDDIFDVTVFDLRSLSARNPIPGWKHKKATILGFKQQASTQLDAIF